MTLLKIIFFPLFLVFWLFRLPWIIYLAAAAGVGYFAYYAYEDYRFNLFEAEFHVAAGVPDATPLSTWNRQDDVTVNGEVNVNALYFSGLTNGTFDPIGLEQGYILLADERGREIKAALVTRPDDLAAVERLLANQGEGDTFAVTVNGMLIRNRDWAGALDRELDRLSIPRATNFVLIEPILGDREAYIHKRAADSIGAPLVLGALAGLLAFYGLIRFLFGFGRGRKTSSAQAKNRARAARRSSQPSQNERPPKQAPEASPWGSFKPIDANNPPPVPTSVSPQAWPKPAGPTKQTAKPSTVATPDPDIQLEPEFVSVFPGGGSGFKFKTADQIIRQTFGTLSSLSTSKPQD